MIDDDALIPIDPDEAATPPTRVDSGPSPEMLALQRKRERMFQRAQAMHRASGGWVDLRSGLADWQQTAEAAEADYDDGHFPFEQLGAAYYLSPEQAATILMLRQRLLDDLGGKPTASEAMLIDLAVVSYWNFMRVQGWVGNSALWLEREYFGHESPYVRIERKQGRIIAATLDADKAFDRIAEQMVPLLERASRMVVRHLAALKAQHQGPAPSVNVAAAAQVNIGQQQVNTAASSETRHNATRKKTESA
jgi:hypothetical protein